jgi:hypothetical protein
MSTCTAICKSGKACSYKAKRDGLCLVHFKAPAAECSICYEVINEDFVLQCNHSFHQKCLAEWIKGGKQTCPICRASVCDKLIKKLIGSELVVLRRAERLLFNETYESRFLDERYAMCQIHMIANLGVEINIREAVIQYLKKRFSRKTSQIKIIQKECDLVKRWLTDSQTKLEVLDYKFMDNMISNLEKLVNFEAIMH